jgi:hypothetical protein
MLIPQKFLVSSKLGLSSMIGNTINHVQCPLTKGNGSFVSVRGPIGKSGLKAVQEIGIQQQGLKNHLY